MEFPDDIASVLQGLGLGVPAHLAVGASDVAIFTGNLEDEPAEAFAVLPSPGYEPDYTHNAGPAMDRPSCMVWRRSLSYGAGEAGIWTAYRELGRVANLAVQGRQYVRLRPTSTPIILKREGDRFFFSFNMDVEFNR